MKRILWLLLLTGCNLGPKLVGPVVPIPEQWKEESAIETVACSPDLWWEVFDDETLSELELQAIAESPDLENALYRVEEAWAMAGVERANLYPQLSFSPNYTNSGELIKLYNPPGNTIPNFPSTPYRIHQLSYYLQLNLSYELDLWGRIRNDVKAGCLSAEAQVNAYKASLLTLTTEVASAYYTLRTLEATLMVYKREIEARQAAVDFFSSRYEKGVGNRLDVETARIELANTEAAYQASLREKTQQENRLSALIGRAPQSFNFPPLSIDQPPPIIPAGIPSDILFNRPDIGQLDLNRAAENARIGSAYASFFPSFTLTGALGYLSPTTQDFLKWESRYWGMGVAMDQTLFDGFRKCQNYQVAWARFDEADAEYRKLVLNAFREVEDALTLLRHELKRKELFQSAQKAASTSLSLSSSRFRTGLSTRLEVIDNERSTLAAELNTLDAAGTLYQATLQLIKALGGSWGTCTLTPD
jgi:multidrug efflux system outer membrane protein